jgi:hypothetical protein
VIRIAYVRLMSLFYNQGRNILQIAKPTVTTYAESAVTKNKQTMSRELCKCARVGATSCPNDERCVPEIKMRKTWLQHCEPVVESDMGRYMIGYQEMKEVIAQYDRSADVKTLTTCETKEPQIKKEYIGPADLLIKAGFTSEPSEPGMFYRGDVCFNINYDRAGETVINSSSGAIIERLPTNTYAFLGWLIKFRLVDFMFAEKIGGL